MMKGGKEGISRPTCGSADDYATTTPPGANVSTCNVKHLSHQRRERETEHCMRQAFRSRELPFLPPTPPWSQRSG